MSIVKALVVSQTGQRREAKFDFITYFILKDYNVKNVLNRLINEVSDHKGLYDTKRKH